MLIFAVMRKVVYTIEYYVNRKVNIISGCVTNFIAARPRVRARLSVRACVSVRPEARNTSDFSHQGILFTNLMHEKCALLGGTSSASQHFSHYVKALC